MRKYGFILFMMLLVACNSTEKQEQKSKKDAMLKQKDALVQEVVDSLTAEYPDVDAGRINKGVKQVASLWRQKDGEAEAFKSFCKENFVGDPEKRHKYFNKFQRGLEKLHGYFHEMQMDLSEPLDLDMGKITKVDMKYGSYDPSAHLDADLYENKLAFMMALNFPFYSLEEKQQQGPQWSRKEWAYARMGDRFIAREPSELLQKRSEIFTDADTYISGYNIFMGNLRTKSGKQLFPDDMRLITHWGLRDELKSNYQGKQGLEKQEMIYQVMKRIITQTIPEKVINNENLKWNPYSNKVYKEEEAVEAPPEPNTRYQKLLNTFQAVKALDKYNPQYPTYIQRNFSGQMEIRQKKIEQIFRELCSSPVVKKVGELISKRLGRDLRPFDIWYDGFKARSGVNQSKLDKKVRQKYPTREAFQDDLDNVLQKLGFEPNKARFLSSKIHVDASRGAGHAAGADMKGAKARLRTRIGEDGMNYKGYNIAIHEFGHTVEQTISLYDVDNWIMNGVPNTALTEALAFIFQKRDLELLGVSSNTPNRDALRTLDNLWSAYEIMGVSLVDMELWKWMYKNPDATPEVVKKQTVKIAKNIWNQYYAPVFGTKDEPVLAIYSHMIAYPLHLSSYPVGQLAEFQLEKHLEGKDFGDEVVRMYKAGRLTPHLWMKRATGEKLSAQPLIEAADKAAGKL